MKRKTRQKRRRCKKSLLIFVFTIIMLFSVAFVVSLVKSTGASTFFDFFQFSGQVATTKHGWNLILVNQDYRMPKKHDIELTELSNGQSVDSRIYPALQQMFDDSRAQGVYPVVASGFRTAKQQQALMNEKVESFILQGHSRSEAKTEAGKWVSAVGYSEHQTGLAVDINADGVMSTGQQVYDWLSVNAWRYGFILRYPDNKIDITGIDYEPWHYRYVGVEVAAKIYEQGSSFEEYMNDLNNSGSL